MTSRILARIIQLRAAAVPDEGALVLLEYAVANVRAPMTRRARLALAARLAFTALTGRRSPA